MSSNETQAALSRAYALVEDGKLDEAKSIVELILATDQNNVDAWWIYAHAVSDPDEGIRALQNVLRIDPNYPGASELMDLAQDSTPAHPNIRPVGSPQAARTPEPPMHLPEANIREPEPDWLRNAEPVVAAGAPAPATASRGLPILPIVAVVIIVVLVALVLISQNSGGTTTPATPTQAVLVVSPSQPIVAVTEATTEEPTVTALVTGATPEIQATEQVIASEAPVPTLAAVTEQATTFVQTTSQANPVAIAAVQGALAQFPVAQNGVTAAQTSLGNTLLVSVCSTPGRAMRALLPQVMNALAKQSGSLDASIQAVGVRMINCDQNTPLLSVAVDMASAQSYAQGKLSDNEFAALWKPQ